MHEVAELRCSVLIWVGIAWVVGWFAPVSAQRLPVTITPGPPPEPLQRIVQAPFALELFFDDLPQGGVGLVRVLGEGQRSLTLRAFDEEWPGFAVGDAHYALLAAHYSQAARYYRLIAQIEDVRGIIHVIEAKFRVSVGNFIRSEATMPYERAALLDRGLEQEEAELLGERIAPLTEPAWVRLQLPLDRPLSSPFGEFRRFNEEYQTRHTGWDFRATIGTPVAAMAGGRVVYSGWLVLRGNYLLIDHGAGLYSGYAHLSQAHVVRGQRIHPGQIIGRVGNSGRSTAAHLHWDVALHGRWVDGVAVVEMWLPVPQSSGGSGKSS